MADSKCDLPADLREVLQATEGCMWVGSSEGPCKAKPGIIYIGEDSDEQHVNKEVWFVDTNNVLGSGRFAIWHAHGRRDEVEDEQPVGFWARQGARFSCEPAARDVRALLASRLREEAWPCHRYQFKWNFM